MKKTGNFVLLCIAMILLPWALHAQEAGGKLGATDKAHEWINISGKLKQGQVPVIYPSNINIDRGAKVLWHLKR